MPIIKFHGVSVAKVATYYERVAELSTLINVKTENIFLIATDNCKIFSEKSTLYVTVEWLCRRDKEHVLVKHLTTFFQDDFNKIVVFFTDVNEKLYIDGQKIG